MSANRQFGRNQIKAKFDSNHIQSAWRRSQIEKYGFHKWFDMRVKCDSKKRRTQTLSVSICR